MKYIFILGRTADLSIAEIRSVLSSNKIEHNILETSKEVAIIEATTKLNIEGLNKKLGGIVKIGKLIEEKGLSQDYSEIVSEGVLLNLVSSEHTGKVEFGISIYNLNGDWKLIDNLVKEKFETTKTIKAWLEQKGIKVHFPHSMDRFLSSAAVGKNKLIEKGFEILIIVGKDKIMVGKTLAIQEFEEFSKRDYGRPQRDLKSGIMPPKLARVMINLAELNKEQTILDPFCGSGTVIQEALFLGYSNIIGTDISEKAIDDTKKNLEWVSQRFFAGSNPAGSDPVGNVRIEQKDVRMLSKIIDLNSIDAIVTEPYLGPTLHQRESAEVVNKTKQGLERLYLDAFAEFKKVLKRGGVVVIIFPVFQGHRQVYLGILNKITGMGYQQIALSQAQRKTILVGNRFDFVLREVAKFQLP